MNVFVQAQQTEMKLIQNIESRTLLSLNGRWQYIIDPYEMGYYDYRYEPFDQSASGTGGFYDDRKQNSKSDLVEYNFDFAPSLNVPADWNSQAEKLEFYEGTIWYRRKFNIAREQGKHYVLHFGAVNYEAHVYLNGKKLGMHKGGFTPFQFEVTEGLTEGENVLIVKADNKRKRTEVPTVNTDWWNYGGITRDVSLITLSSNYIAAYKVQLSKNKMDQIEGYVQLSDKSAEVVTLNIPELHIKQVIKTDVTGNAKFSIPVRNVKYWTPENPKLYEISLQHAADEVSDRIGLRTIAVVGKDILLNQKSIFLRGISMHDEDPLIRGRLRSEGDMRMMLQWAKELNCNFVRLAHYTHNETMIRLADEMGLMVWAEVPVYWTIAWENQDTYNNAKSQLTNMIERDKNRASVIIWSIGNETPLSEPRHKFMRNMAEQARSVDNTRLVAAALEVHRNGTEVVVDDPLGEVLDLASFNEYGGWYWELPPDLKKYTFKIKYDKPVVITEFGGEALAGYHADAETRWSEEFQESLYVNQLAMLKKVDALRGMTPWILIDFRSPRRQHPYYQDFWNRKGLLSETGKKKKAFFVLRNFYDTIEKQYK
jgi:beta-glucuronidase